MRLPWHEYPLSDEIREELKRYQGVLELKDQDVARIEAKVTSQDNAIPSSDEDLVSLEIPIEEAAVLYPGQYRYSRKELQRTLELSDSDVASIETRLVSQQETVASSTQAYSTTQPSTNTAEYQEKLKRYEQEVKRIIQYGLYPSHYRYSLKKLQRTLKLTDSEVASIETRLVSPRKTVKWRPCVLLGSTALGLVLFFSSLRQASTPLFFLGCGIILVGAIIYGEVSKR